MDYRVLTEAERKYTFSQSQQLSMQTGLIGYLRADFGSNGNEFWTTWNDFRKDLKTDEFKAEFDEVINGLRDGDVLSGRKAMSSYCYSTPDSSFNDDCNHYGIRLDTGKYSYLMRFNPNRGEYNLYCYCYQKEWLNAHLKNAERGIRFINPHYQEQFRIADGEKISIKLGDGKTMERTCRYLVLGKMRVDVDSFEDWYAGQFHYEKVNGERPGKKYGKTLSPLTVAKVLGIPRSTANDLMNDGIVEFIWVDGKRRIKRESFDKWYASQSKYTKVKEIEEVEGYVD